MKKLLVVSVVVFLVLFASKSFAIDFGGAITSIFGNDVDSVVITDSPISGSTGSFTTLDASGTATIQGDQTSIWVIKQADGDVVFDVGTKSGDRGLDANSEENYVARIVLNDSTKFIYPLMMERYAAEAGTAVTAAFGQRKAFGTQSSPISTIVNDEIGGIYYAGFNNTTEMLQRYTFTKVSTGFEAASADAFSVTIEDRSTATQYTITCTEGTDFTGQATLTLALDEVSDCLKDKQDDGTNSIYLSVNTSRNSTNKLNVRLKPGYKNITYSVTSGATIVVETGSAWVLSSRWGAFSEPMVRNVIDTDSIWQVLEFASVPTEVASTIALIWIDASGNTSTSTATNGTDFCADGTPTLTECADEFEAWIEALNIVDATGTSNTAGVLNIQYSNTRGVQSLIWYPSGADKNTDVDINETQISGRSWWSIVPPLSGTQVQVMHMTGKANLVVGSGTDAGTYVTGTQETNEASQLFFTAKDHAANQALRATKTFYFTESCDNGTDTCITLPNPTTHGEGVCWINGTASAHCTFIVDNTGAVTLISDGSVSGSATNACSTAVDNANTLNIYDGGTNAEVENNNGATEVVICRMFYD